MDKTLCEQFDTLRSSFPDDLDKSTNLNFKNLGNFMNYCFNGESKETECKTYLDNINAGCLWLLDQLFVKKKKKNINTFQYIIIWLSYKLNQKKYDGIKDLNDFYNKYIENNTHYTSCNNDSEDCSKQLQDNTGYPNYKEIINGRKRLLSTNIEKMSKIYDAFKPLCKMYTGLNANEKTNKNYLDCASKFVEKYNELNVSDIDNDSPYHQVLSTLLNDYNNFKSYCDTNGVDCNDIPSLVPTEREGNDMQSSEEICYVTPPSLSIVKKLILALLIFSTISIFLGIFFKCSLFVLRKRAQKEYLREKLKNIKKRMNH
ncbi:PIR protein [Plasmodium yoelii]|uniref:PIR protein n=2 Tax=Plasmodium yoelii TaxID=5861 RepID=A0AAF0B6Q7_PLAYO|nr:PIR protein [Plasmodium yoelii]WBY59624.1 PIR protein [Plasmodium yoelii yoelii]VTZ80365.1 PIR protein [Plasmodium yoelii]|eukprot:XP_022811110.1 PIR protein [Plasmodium yoelii]